jgi:hypothetical protein
MSKRVSQSWARPASWLVAGAGSAGIIALSLAVFLQPTPKVPVARQIEGAAQPVLIVASVGTGHNKAEQLAMAEPVVAKAQNTPGAPIVSQEKVALESAAIAKIPVAGDEQPPITAPKTFEARLAQVHDKAPQNSLGRTNPTTAAIVAKPAAHLPPPSSPMASPSSGVATRLPAQLPPANKPSLAPQTETVTVTGYRQTALNVDGIGRGNSLTIQLPTAVRK